MNRSLWMLMLPLATMAGCDKADATPPAPAATVAPAPAAPPAPSAAAAPTPAAAAPAGAVADLPTSVDFEQQAQDEINPQNMEKELDCLEKDIVN